MSNDLFKPITSLDSIPASPGDSKKERTSRRRGNSGRNSRFDAAQTTDENKNHWAAADALSANAANSPDVRYKLRNRSRYETQNNGYAKGLNVGRANDTIGTGPRLQLTLPERMYDPDFQRVTAVPSATDLARAVEQKWQDWCDLIGLTDDLHVMDRSETREGETIAVMITNPALPESGPQLDLALVEADQLCSPDLNPMDPYWVDGIKFDAAGNPVSYDILRRHPGDTFVWGSPLECDRYPAHRVIHLFDRDRAGQARGIPALTPGLPLFAQLRRFTLASLGAAELAAMIAGVIENDNAPPVDGDEEAPEFEAMDAVPFARNALLTLPAGQKAHAFKSEQPVPGFKEFKGEILTEAGRGVNAPRNVSTGSSAEYNYSSGRLDHLPYQTSIKIRRDRFRRHVLNRVFAVWLAEAVLIQGYLPEGLPPVSTWRWKWQWDGFASIDPVKDALANEIKLASGQTTLDDVCAEQGKDWEELLEQQAREMRKRRELGLPDPNAKQAGAAAPNEDAEDDDAVPAGGSAHV